MLQLYLFRMLGLNVDVCNEKSLILCIFCFAFKFVSVVKTPTRQFRALLSWENLIKCLLRNYCQWHLKYRIVFIFVTKISYRKFDRPFSFVKGEWFPHIFFSSTPMFIFSICIEQKKGESGDKTKQGCVEEERGYAAIISLPSSCNRNIAGGKTWQSFMAV